MATDIFGNQIPTASSVDPLTGKTGLTEYNAGPAAIAKDLTAETGTSSGINSSQGTLAPGVTSGIAGAGVVKAIDATRAADITAGTGTTVNAGLTTATGAAPVTAGIATAGQVGSIQNAEAGTAVGTQTSVNAPTDTVAGQIRSLIDAGSPLMTQADTRAKQTMNARGLVNSSMAVQAGQAALYDAALPIASADANTYNQTRLVNQQATNTASTTNAGLTTDVSKFNAAQKLSAATTNAQLFTEIAKINVNNALQAGIVNQEQANKMAQFNAANANDIGKFNAMSANDMQKFNIDSALKASIINQEQANKMSQFDAAQQLDANKATAQLYTDVSKFNVDGALRAGIINQDQANKMSQTNAQMSQDADKFTAASANDMAKFNVDNAFKAGIINQDQANKMAQFNADNASKLAVASMQNDADIAKFNASESNKLIQLGIDANTKGSLAQIEAKYKTQMQSNAGMADLYKQTALNLATIMTNKDLTDKTQAVDNSITILNNGLKVLAAMSGVGIDGDFITKAETPGGTGYAKYPETAIPSGGTAAPQGGIATAPPNQNYQDLSGI